MKVYEVFLHEGACSCVSKDIHDTLAFLEHELVNCEVGTQVTIAIKEMSEKELANLPEWNGP